MKAKIALFVNEPVASRSCANGIMKALEGHRFQLFSRKTISAVNFNEIDLVAFPGGQGEADLYDRLMKPHSHLITNYMNNGGRFLGICMGAYWADSNYFNLLKDVRVVQYITQPKSEISRSYPTIANVRWGRKSHNMYFYDGCAFVGDRFKKIATYKNGDPMAIIQNRVGLIGCHPESQKNWYKKPYMKEHWHEGAHNRLLREFVDKLLGL